MDSDDSYCFDMIKEMMRHPKGKRFMIDRLNIEDYLYDNNAYDIYYTYNEMIKKWFELIMNVSTNGLPEFFIHEYYDVNNTKCYKVNNNNCFKIDANNFDLCDISKIFFCYCDSSQHEVYGKIYYIIGEIKHALIFVRIVCSSGRNTIKIIISDSIKEFVSYGISGKTLRSYAKKMNQKKRRDAFGYDYDDDAFDYEYVDDDGF